VEVYLYCTVINHGINFIVEMKQSDLLYFQAVILEGCPLFPTLISPLEPSRKFMYRKVYTSKNYKYCITGYLCVLYDSKYQENILPYTAIVCVVIITEMVRVFTAQ